MSVLHQANTAAAAAVPPAAASTVPPTVSAEHRYGGAWTELKLDAVQYYLDCYTKALKRVPFDLTYIDAFAGTGSRQTVRTTGGLLEGAPVRQVQETLAGSARRAFEVQPAFDHFVFIEKDRERCAALSALCTEYPNADIDVIPGDANKALRDLVKKEPWCRTKPGNSRGVVFLDPYALHVDWKTLQALASTQVLDVWYLFPIRDTIRQLAHDFAGIGPKEPMLDRLLGPEWRELYEIAPIHQTLDLFERPVETGLTRTVSAPQFEQWLKKRLENEFEFVSDPLPILTSPTKQAFSLFLAVSNPSAPAIDLAKKFVRYVNKNFAPGATRQRSGP